MGQPLYPECRAITDWLASTYGMRYSVSGLTDRLGANALDALSYQLTAAVPYQAGAGVQTVFLADALVPLLAQVAAGGAVVYFADASHPTHHTHHTRATHVWAETGKERPLLTVSGRERGNPNAALNVHCSTQVHLDKTDCVNAQST